MGNCRDADEAFRIANYEKAIGLYFVYLEDFPDDLRAWINLGISFGRIGKSAEALKCFVRALELDARSSEAWLNRGIALAALGQHEDALDSYERVLALKPDHQQALLKKVEALRVLGHDDEANALFRDFVERRKAQLGRGAGPDGQ